LKLLPWINYIRYACFLWVKSLTKVLAEEGSLRVVWWLLFLTWVVPQTMEKVASVSVEVEVKTQEVIWWCYIKLSTTDTSIIYIYSDKSNNHRMRWKFLWARQVDKTSLAAVRTLGLLLTNQHTKYVIWGFFEPAYTQLSIQPLLFLGPTKSLVTLVHFSVDR
jgi:hypothetical protein